VLLLGDGHGAFQPAIHFGVGSDPGPFDVGDFNGDGRPDLVGANQNSGDISIVMNDSYVRAGLDIKPGSFPNSINRGSRGRIPVAILSSAGFDAFAAVNRSTLTFGRTGGEQSLAFCNPGLDDVNRDRLPDLVCHFDTERTGFRLGDRRGVLKGKTVNGFPIRGMDSVRIVP